MVLLPKMDPKAHRAEGASRVTLAIALCSFTAFNTWVVDVFHLPLGKFLCRVIPHALIFFASDGHGSWTYGSELVKEKVQQPSQSYLLTFTS